jgi:bacterioferritin
MPKAPAEIIEALQTSLRDHWSQIASYETQAAHFDRWGYKKLGEEYRDYAEEERGHAKSVVARLEFFDVHPVYDFDEPLWPRHDFEGVLTANYAAETMAADHERAGWTLCLRLGDGVTASVFADLLAGSEEGIAHIEAVREVIDNIGMDNYLADRT